MSDLAHGDQEVTMVPVRMHADEFPTNVGVVRRLLAAANALRTARNEPEETSMPRYVIGPDVVRRMAQERVVVANDHQLLAPTLLRSQLLSLLYRAVRRGELTKQEADHQLTYVRGLQIRLLGDRVLQSVAWKIADQLGWPDTFDAEYVALTQLQADALITLDREFAAAVQGLVIVAPFEALCDADSRLEA